MASTIELAVRKKGVRLPESNIQTHHNDKSDDGPQRRQHTISSEITLGNIKTTKINVLFT